ncbi:ABC transporter ATP-binding protein [Azospirillum canadense]|uniref:ABC transporter ATP-binding protein n=1 Tax=Azospirillum canadense TaxID=403962 RepID=UPI002226BBAC|nr:ABC transporter ATP-binding protein [Azospirillum canadense]MCW2240510.1 iron(III) transport system ATP-binding protein [Azospirillum canadense]
MSTSAPFIELAGVHKEFGNFTALADCNLSIRRGEFVTLLGPSGCGKTTTLRMIAGFVRPTRGTIRVGGEILSSPTAHVPPEGRGMGMVFQSYAVWPHMTVRQNVALPLKLRKIARPDIDRRVDEVLHLCRLDGLGDRDPHQLSGGQLQRVALARALVYRPSVVLLDEPLSNLDVALREELRHELASLHRAIGATFILVTHDQVEAMSLSDRVVVMKEGRIEQIGPPEEIYRNPKTDFVAQFVGAANLVKGKVSSVRREPAGKSCEVRVGGVVFPAVRGWDGAAEGDTVTLAMHPESIRLQPIGPGEPGMGYQGFVRGSYFLGRTQEILVELDGMELRVMQVRSRHFEIGERVGVTIANENVIPLVHGA